jgi:hypothetical protein
MKKLTFALAVGCLMICCTPERRIVMINDTEGDVEFSWKIREADNMHYNPFFISNSDVVQFRLKPKAPFDEVRMSFGDGSWKSDTLKALTSTLEYLKIRSAEGEIKLDSPDAIYRFLAGRRKGIGRRKIEIKITR